MKAFQVAGILFVCIISVSSQDIVFDTLPVNQTVVEGGDATFACSGTVDGTPQPTRYRIRSGVTVLQSVGGNISALSAVDGIEAALVFGDFNSQVLLRNITREANGYTVSCAIRVGAVFLDAMNPPTTFITVLSPPVYTVFSNQPVAELERVDFLYVFEFDAFPAPTNFTWSRDGQVISSGGRTATSVSTISITSTTRSDSGVYEVVSYNEAGRGAGNFTLDVQYPPELTTPLSPALLITGTSFSFNCTPSAANPPVDTVSIDVDGSPVTSGDTVTVTDNVLTIPSVQRSHSGNYSCTATNTRGSAVIYQHLLVTDSVPLIARVAVRFVTSSSLEVVTRLTTNGGRDVLHYYIVLNGVASVFSGGGNQSVLSATVSTGGPRPRGKEEEEWSVSVVVENALGNSSEVVVVLQGQPSSVSDAVTVADMSSAVIGLSVTVALVTVLSVTTVIISLVVIIVLCHRQASYRVKTPSPKEGDYQMEDVKEVKLESNPAYEAVTTS